MLFALAERQIADYQCRMMRGGPLSSIDAVLAPRRAVYCLAASANDCAGDSSSEAGMAKTSANQVAHCSPKYFVIKGLLQQRKRMRGQRSQPCFLREFRGGENARHRAQQPVDNPKCMQAIKIGQFHLEHEDVDRPLLGQVDHLPSP